MKANRGLSCGMDRNMCILDMMLKEVFNNIILQLDLILVVVMENHLQLQYYYLNLRKKLSK